MKIPIFFGDLLFKSKNSLARWLHERYPSISVMLFEDVLVQMVHEQDARPVIEVYIAAREQNAADKRRSTQERQGKSHKRRVPAADAIKLS